MKTKTTVPPTVALHPAECHELPTALLEPNPLMRGMWDCPRPRTLIDEWVEAIQYGRAERATKRARDQWLQHCLSLALDRSGEDLDFVTDIFRAYVEAEVAGAGEQSVEVER